MRFRTGRGSNPAGKARDEPAREMASRLSFVGILPTMALFLLSCDSSTKVRGEVMKTFESPGGDVTATLTRGGDYGATVPWIYRVYLNSREDHRQWEVLDVFSNYNEFAVSDLNVRTITVHLENGGLCPDEGVRQE